jgi:hypothetical protein
MKGIYGRKPPAGSFNIERAIFVDYSFGVTKIFFA